MNFDLDPSLKKKNYKRPVGDKNLNMDSTLDIITELL